MPGQSMSLRGVDDRYKTSKGTMAVASTNYMNKMGTDAVDEVPLVGFGSLADIQSAERRCPLHPQEQTCSEPGAAGRIYECTP